MGFDLSSAPWATLLSLGEYLSSLIVALAVVWLGFRYQRRLADRSDQRRAFLDAFEDLAVMLDMVELQESLRFAMDQLAASGEAKTDDERTRLLEADDRLSNVAHRIGFEMSWEKPVELPEGGIALATPSPVRIGARVSSVFNGAQTRLRSHHLNVVLANPVAVHQSAFISGFLALGQVEEGAKIAFEGLVAEDVSVPDWGRLTILFEAAQTQVFRLFGGDLGDRVRVRQYREHIPWPDTVKARPPARQPSTTPPTLFGGPSVFVGLRSSRRR